MFIRFSRYIYRQTPWKLTSENIQRLSLSTVQTLRQMFELFGGKCLLHLLHRPLHPMKSDISHEKNHGCWSCVYQLNDFRKNNNNNNNNNNKTTIADECELYLNKKKLNLCFPRKLKSPLSRRIRLVTTTLLEATL